MKNYNAFSLVLVLFFVGISYAVPPANDNFENSITLPGSSGSVTGSNSDATLESGEPVHYYSDMAYGSNSVWYTWTAPETAHFSFDTSNFMACVYTGSAIDNLTKIKLWGESITIAATNETVYQIALFSGNYTSTGQVVINYYKAELSPWISEYTLTQSVYWAKGSIKGSLACCFMDGFITFQRRTNQFGKTADINVQFGYNPKTGITVFDKKGNKIVDNVNPPSAGSHFYPLDFDGKLLLLCNPDNGHVIAYKVKNGLTLLNEQNVGKYVDGIIDGSRIYLVPMDINEIFDADEGLHVFDKKLKNEKWSLPIRQGKVNIHSFKKELVSSWTENGYDLNVVFFKKGKKQTEHNIPLPMDGIIEYSADGKGGMLYWKSKYYGPGYINSPLTYIDKKKIKVFENRSLPSSGNIWRFENNSTKNLFTAVDYGSYYKIISYKIDKNMKKMGDVDVLNFDFMEFSGKELVVYQRITDQNGFTVYNSKLKEKWIEPVSPGELQNLRNGVFMRIVLTPGAGQTNYNFKIFNKRKTISEHQLTY